MCAASIVIIILVFNLVIINKLHHCNQFLQRQPFVVIRVILLRRYYGAPLHGAPLHGAALHGAALIARDCVNCTGLR